MRYLFLLLFLVGCGQEQEKTSIQGVNKFTDGDVVCYTYYTHGISCVRKK